MKTLQRTLTLLLATWLVFAPGQPLRSQTTLKDAFQDHFYVGAALNGSRIMGRDTLAKSLIESQFSSLTPENDMKWERIHPRPGVYRFDIADQLVAMGQEQDKHLVAHTLIWHNQTPRWVFQDSQGNLTTRDTLLMRMQEHIQTIMGRYKGKIHTWDVVNEALDDRGRLRETLWKQIIGDDYIEKAFQFAHEADPDAQLIYNDFSMAGKGKREGTVRMVRDLQSKGIRIDGVGMQCHYDLDSPSLEDIEASIVAFAELGVEVMITELDLSVLPSPYSNPGGEMGRRNSYRPELDPYRDHLPDSVLQLQAQRYADLFTIFVKHSDKISRVTFWGVDDGTSWKNNFPVRGRIDYALLFDRKYQPKPAFDAVIRSARQE